MTRAMAHLRRVGSAAVVLLGLLVGLGVAAPGAEAAWTYAVSRTLPCALGCQDQLEVAGSITVDQQGSIQHSAITAWSITVSDPGFASGDLHLLFRVIDSRDVGEEKAAPQAAFVLDNHAIDFRIQFLHNCRLRVMKHVN